MSDAAFRLAAAGYLSGVADDIGFKLQMYPGRPRTLFPPVGFIDRISAVYTSLTERTFTGLVSVQAIILFGLFDSADAAAQKDEFVDALTLWAYAHGHAAGPNTINRVSETADLPDYVPEWIPPDQQRTYYACQVTLEGFTSN